MRPALRVRAAAAHVARGSAIALGLATAACSALPSTTAESSAAAVAIAPDEGALLFGDDRVAAALKGDMSRVPSDFRGYEQLFQVGRACARTDSKEIYVVEESSSRAGEGQTATEQLLPRAVVTGCNTNRQDPSSVALSYGLMTALISAPNDAAPADTMILSPLEVMAFDNTTSRYNFYVFEPSGGAGAGTVTRVVRQGDGSIVDFVKAPGRPLETRASTHFCFSCHANGGPLMNEMSEPWTNWISTRKMFPKEATFTGETFSIVNEAASLKHDDERSSLANQLEETMVAAVRAFVNGSSKTTGHGAATLAGDQPGGLARLMRSVFCQTELKYVSVDDTAPFELFVDPATVAQFNLPKPEASSPFLTLFPVRSEMDKRIEQFLLLRRVLSMNTVLAVRLVDDQNDVFSDARCAIHDAVAPGLPSDLTQVDAYVRQQVTAALAQQPDGARKAYAMALLDPTKSAADVTAARNAYRVDVTARLADGVAHMNSGDAIPGLHARNKARQDAARALFPGAANPLPVLSE